MAEARAAVENGGFSRRRAPVLLLGWPPSGCLTKPRTRARSDVRRQREEASAARHVRTCGAVEPAKAGALADSTGRSGAKVPGSWTSRIGRRPNLPPEVLPAGVGTELAL